ncbi:hypothetical protein UY3_02428 [Chelonia mydas]|uniref:Uncharacterized protein n=1 Tax=Chelonia mydas TaxID=8469 RepID=M7BWS4_CHEMY|nr:hypothetical protein UY3_02428 [Chelonia mydas]
MEWKSIDFMKKLIQIQTDIIFLSKCKQMDIIPKGLKSLVLMAHSASLLFDSFFTSFSSSCKRKIASMPYAVADALQVLLRGDLRGAHYARRSSVRVVNTQSELIVTGKQESLMLVHVLRSCWMPVVKLKPSVGQFMLVLVLKNIQPNHQGAICVFLDWPPQGYPGPSDYLFWGEPVTVGLIL